MFLDIKELGLHPLEFAEEFQPDVIDLGSEARQRGPLKATGRAEIVEEHHGKHQVIKDIRLRGKLSAGLELQCARCLEPVRQEVDAGFRVAVPPLGRGRRTRRAIGDRRGGRDRLLSGRGIAARRCLARAGAAGVALERSLAAKIAKGCVRNAARNLNQEKCSCSVRSWKIRDGRP